MNYVTREDLWFPVVIHTRDVNGKHILHKMPDISQVCEYIDEMLLSPNSSAGEEEILMVVVDGICIYSQLGNDPITWDDILGFFA